MEEILATHMLILTTCFAVLKDMQLEFLTNVNLHLNLYMEITFFGRAVNFFFCGIQQCIP